MFAAALLAAAAGWGVRLLIDSMYPLPKAFLIFSIYGLLYFFFAGLFRLREAEVLRDRLLRRLTPRR
jgi:hypothetical protein